MLEIISKSEQLTFNNLPLAIREATYITYMNLYG